MNAIGRGLLKEILVDEVRLLRLPGWEIFEEGDLLALKSPVAAPFIDLVYGKVSATSFEKVKDFYQKKPFSWLVPAADKDTCLLSEWKFKGPDISFEMVLNLDEYRRLEWPTSIHVKTVCTQQDFEAWTQVVAVWLNVDPVHVQQFFKVWIQTGKYVAYLGCVEGEPAATALVSFDTRGAALHCIGTLPAFRRCGLGTAVTRACLEAAFLKGMPCAVLYASEMGRPIYEKIGFQCTQTLHGYMYSGT